MALQAKAFLTLICICLGMAAKADPAFDPASLVGRLNLGRGGFCTATLIAPQMIVTAAHCVSDPKSGDIAAVATMRFFLSLSSGGAGAARKITDIAIAPKYLAAKGSKNGLSHDIAVARLDAPVEINALTGLEYMALPNWRAHVQLFRYDRTHPRQIARQSCTVDAAQAGLGLLSCAVESGASGAPVFVKTQEGLKLAAIVSRKVSAPHSGSLVASILPLVSELERQIQH